ncbi:MAG TPA: RDD family protein [Terriglobia bacterium]|nr:RDD family protein [Terriglobia bacterium]
MTCPKCGYVSFPGLPECRKCGHPLTQTRDSKAPRLSFSPPYEAAPLVSPKPLQPPKTRPSSFSEKNTESGRSGEIFEKVARFRRHRESEASLKFDFDATAGGEIRPHTPPGIPAEDILDQAFKAGSSTNRQIEIASTPLEGRSGPQETGVLPIDSNRSSEYSAPARQRTNPQSNPFSPLEPLELPDAAFTNSPDQEEFAEPAAAPLRKRFLAGLADAGILLVAGCLFAGLFTLVRGKLEPTPLDLAVAGFIVIFWIFFYFGSFTAIALRTPGQAAFGLSVSNLDGERPTRQEASLRAFGYLVSLAALMLGFLWAAMDSDGMAWHDHISGTILVENT